MLVDFFSTENIFFRDFRFRVHENPRFRDEFQDLVCYLRELQQSQIKQTHTQQLNKHKPINTTERK